MQETAELFFDWVGRNENILSGLVAIAVLISLLWATIRRVGQESLSRRRDVLPRWSRPSLAKMPVAQEGF